jgi:hypothetical protein
MIECTCICCDAEQLRGRADIAGPLALLLAITVLLTIFDLEYLSSA